MYRVYMISYDLYSPSSNREKVMESIESFGTYCKYLTTTYLIKTYKSIDEVQELCSKHLDSNDKMIICEIKKPIKGFLPNSNWSWIHTNL